MKKLVILVLITFALTANAVNIFSLQETFWQKVWRCKWRISCYRQNLGVSITTINATDLIKNSRATINTNFSNLNDGKIENSTSSIAAVTTLANLIETGVLSSSTFRGSRIQVAYGGTGSTTLSRGQVLIGNGIGNASTTDGWGTSGQFLTSNGAGSAPTWTTSATDLGINYSWTGTHSFSGANTYIKNLSASSTSAQPLVLNGVSYDLPSTTSASGTVLTKGSGTSLVFTDTVWRELAASTTVADSTTFTVSFNASSTFLKVLVFTPGWNLAETPAIQFNGNAGGAQYRSCYMVQPVASTCTDSLPTDRLHLLNSTTTPTNWEVNIVNQQTYNKIVDFTGVNSGNETDPTALRITGSGVWKNTTSTITEIKFTGINARNWLSGTIVKILGKN